MARRERGDVPVEEMVGERVAHGNAPTQRQHAGAPYVGIAIPYGLLALLDVHLVERERQEADVPVASGAQSGDHRLVAVAGEGAAVIEAHGELVGHGTSKRCGLTCQPG